MCLKRTKLLLLYSAGFFLLIETLLFVLIFFTLFGDLTNETALRFISSFAVSSTLSFTASLIFFFILHSKIPDNEGEIENI
jgi:hypothetical protein